MCCGIVATALNFVFISSRTSQIETIHHPASNIIRSLPDRLALDSQRERIVALKLRGLQFFGSTRSVIDAVNNSIYTSQHKQVATPLSVENQQLSSQLRDNETMPRTRAFSVGADEESVKAAKRKYSDESSRVEDARKSTRFVVLDCSDVTTIDATAARGCFLAVVFMLNERGIDVVFSGLSDECERILVNHQVINANNELDVTGGHSFDTMNAAIEWCETFLCTALYMNPNQSCTLRSVFPECIEHIRPFFTQVEFAMNEVIIRNGHKANAIYIVQEGSVAIFDQPSKSTNEYNTTSMFGHVDFFHKPSVSTFTAIATKSTKTYVINRQSFNELINTNAKAAIALQQTVLQAMTKQ